MENEEKDLNPDPVDDLYVGSPDYTPSSRWKRLLNYLLDYLCCYATWIVVLFVAGMVAISVGALDVESVENFELSPSVNMLLSLFMYLGYYIFFEGVFGTTPGKEMTRTVLITTEGYRPSFKDALFRSLWRIVPFEAFSFLFSERGLHDDRTGTMVVDKKSYVLPYQPEKTQSS